MDRSPRRLRSAVVAIALAGSGSIAALHAVEHPRLSYADGRPAAAPASASSSPNATSASASASAAYGTPVRKHPLFRDDLPPPEKSEVPKAAEWKSASEIEFDRRPVMGAGCRLLRLREWVRLSCAGPGSMASHIAGPSEGWSARTDPPDPGLGWDKATHFVQFPVRRGERRLMELRAVEPGNYGDGLYMTSGSVISVQWNDGEPPILARH